VTSRTLAQVNLVTLDHTYTQAVLVWLKRFKHLLNVALLGIFGVILLVAGDTTGRIIGSVLIVLALGLIVYRRKRGFAPLF
jgi:hypothetical protein